MMTTDLGILRSRQLFAPLKAFVVANRYYTSSSWRGWHVARWLLY